MNTLNTFTTKRILISLITLIVFLLIMAFIYLLSLHQDRKKTTTALQQEKDLIIEDLNSLKSEYDKAILESNAANEELIAARDDVVKYIDSIHIMKTSITSLSRYRRQVSVLKVEREELLWKIDSLTQSNTMLSMERDSTFVELEKHTVFNDSIVVQNTQLAYAVERTLAVTLSDFTIDAVRERSSGRLVSTSRAKATDKFKVCFTVADNVIAQAGEREFFIEVLDPQGNVMGESFSKSSEEGAKIAYSKETNFYYENSSLDVCDYINKPVGGFQGGNYMVNIYDDNLRLLGTSKFALKGIQNLSNGRDSDRDGVDNSMDQCPNEAGPPENNGCPWQDKDGDGVDDGYDECPDVAGSVGNNGCPGSNINTNKSIIDAPLSTLSPEIRSLKQFPWPPPKYSDRILLHTSWKPLTAIESCKDLGCVAKIISRPLDQNDYEYSFYLLSKDEKFKGFVITTMWEEFNKDDGTYLNDPNKRRATSLSTSEWWNNLKILAFGKEAYFRVIVFAITNLNDDVGGKIMSAKKAKGKVRGGHPDLAQKIATEPLPDSYRIIAYVYAYKIKKPSLKPEELYNILTARKHLKGAKLELLLPD
ncbi:hypothetical protein [Ulvibacterium sp.]|uniref:hypothetical protein n=1 Tax=Ulvibacterium sp. TaxID=2665914 RepID=UPI003BA98A1F